MIFPSSSAFRGLRFRFEPSAVLDFKGVRRFLTDIGFVEVRRKGSHVFFRHPDGRTTTVPEHKGRDIARPLLRKILREVEVTVEVLQKHLPLPAGTPCTGSSRARNPAVA